MSWEAPVEDSIRALKATWPGDEELAATLELLRSAWMNEERPILLGQLGYLGHMLQAIGHLELAGEHAAAVSYKGRLRDHILAGRIPAAPL